MNIFLWSLSLFWAVVYGIQRFKSREASQGLLPISTARSSYSSLKFSKSKGLEFSVRNFHLETRTNALNGSHDGLIGYFERSERRKNVPRNAFIWLYNVGIVFGILGFLVGIGVLGYSTGRLFSAWSVSTEQENRQSFVKRDVETIEANEKSGFVINAIVPGFTVPWSHFPSILLALFIAQCFHEIGHAIAGAMEGLTLQAVGASLTVILPSAFVSFSSSMINLSAAARLRVIASGAWHNLLLWGLLYLASLTRISSIWTILGWKDIRDLGVVVLDVEENSPLVYHLQPGSLITGLDDVGLASTATTEDTWSRYLLKTKGQLDEGWCKDVDAFFDQPTTCCDLNSTNIPVRPSTAQLSCFVPMQNDDQGHCIDPVPLLAGSSTHRCYSALDCNEGATSDELERTLKECVRPEESAQLLRIRVSPPIWETDSGEVKTVLWNGPKGEVWQQVSVGTLSPRHCLLPLWLPSATSTFFSYLSTLSLSLYIFNLFALPFLDGAHFLSAMLDYVAVSRDQTYENEGDTESDIELGVGTERYRNSSTPILLRYFHLSLQGLRARTWIWGRRIRRRKPAIERFVRNVTIMLMCTTVIAMILPA